MITRTIQVDIKFGIVHDGKIPVFSGQTLSVRLQHYSVRRVSPLAFTDAIGSIGSIDLTGLTCSIVLCIASWSYGLIRVLSYLARKGHLHDVYPEVQISVSIFQTLQLLEVVHCIIQLVPSNAVQTFIQILSRLIVVWGVLLPVPEARNAFGVPMLLVAWSLAEMTRYLYYALNIYNLVPYVLTWLRYSLFIVLYPLGVSGELLTFVAAYPLIRDRDLFAIHLPNLANFSFYYHYLLVLIMLGYIPCK